MLTLEDLPSPPADKIGWPWTEQSQELHKQTYTNSSLPRISIVTPNYNQGQYIEETIRSVLLQGYPNIEYIIIDAGSTDNSVEVIKKYERYLTYWVSEPDRGQSHGINKGFQKATGDYITWANSSDFYMPNALKSLFGKIDLRGIDFIYGNSVYVGTSLNDSQPHYNSGVKSFELKYLLRFFYSPIYIVPSQSVFISKKLIDIVGLLNEDQHYCMDLEWFARIALNQPPNYRVENPLSFYRLHDDAKTTLKNQQMMEESVAIAKKYMNYLTKTEKHKLDRLLCYSTEYSKYQLGKKDKSLINMLKTVLKLPQESLSDTRFLGMIKQALLNRVSAKSVTSVKP